MGRLLDVCNEDLSEDGLVVFNMLLVLDGWGTFS